MTNIKPIESVNPLYLPVEYNEKTYYTSQYFHRQYQENKPEGGKYAQLQHFNRLIRSIETYPEYVERGDIVELDKEKASPDLGLVFKATYGKPVMLINATAQVALTHHLDDEISKQISVKVNESVAKAEVKRQLEKSKDTIASLMLVDKWLRGMDGVDPLLLTTKTLESIQINTGLNVALIGAAVPHTKNPVPDLNPTAVGKRVNMGAAAVNILLESLGLQRKNERNEWVLTEKGAQYGSMQPYTNNGHTSYRPLWFSSVIELIRPSANDESAHEAA